MRPADEAAMARAIEAFLEALGLEPGADWRDLAGTPRRVAEAWARELLGGYGKDPAALLAEASPAERGADLVVVSGLDVVGMCPHHLLPYRGVATVAYVPGERVAGFGQLAQLVDCLARRLALQEDVARAVTRALMEHLGAKGAACALDVEQGCLSTRGERQAHARTYVDAFAGIFETDAGLRERFDRRVPGAR